jgi:hypothetical protein
MAQPMQRDDGFAGAGGPTDPGRPAVFAGHDRLLLGMKEGQPRLERPPLGGGELVGDGVDLTAIQVRSPGWAFPLLTDVTATWWMAPAPAPGDRGSRHTSPRYTRMTARQLC